MEFKYIYEAFPAENENETGIFRSRYCKQNDGNLIVKSKNFEGETLYEMIQYSTQKYKNKQFMGYRNILDTIQETKQIERKTDGKLQKVDKTWSFYKLSEYQWISFDQFNEKLIHLSSGLAQLGLDKNEKVSFYAPSNHLWLMLSYACFYRSLIVATIYDTLGADGLLHGINECESTTLFLSSEQLPVLKKIQEEAKTLKNVIYSGELPKDYKDQFPNLNFYDILELEKMGQSKPVEATPPSPDDLAVIMYTSGSTGNPKGVLLKHRNVISQLAGIDILAKNLLSSDDRAISFLPLAHIYAFLLITLCFSMGLEVGFATPRTLMDQSVRGCRGDLYELKPTLLPGVPQVFDTVRKGILNQLNKANELVKASFNYSLIIKDHLTYWNLPTKWIDNLIFNKIKDVVGGNLRKALTGGAPISDETKSFFKNAVCNVYQAYGMTELCGLGTVTIDEDNYENTVGEINPTIELKLVDVPDAGYFSKDLKGEIWMRGPCITEGYFKNEKATNETITKDNWIRTGDIGYINKLGQLCIIDRIKNLVKLSNGEYIALEKLESVYRNSIYVQNICVCANSHMIKPVALIQPNLVSINHYLKSNGKNALNDIEELNDDEITKIVLSSCLEQAKLSNLNGANLISGVYLTPTEWTVENGLTTGAQKVKRRALQDRFQEQLDKLYKEQ